MEYIRLLKWLLGISMQVTTHNTIASNQTLGNKNKHKALHTTDGKN